MSDARELASDPRLARLWERARAHLERTGAREPRGRVSLPAPSDEERAAVGRLFGTRSRAQSLAVDLVELDRVLRDAGTGLIEVLVAFGGPLRDRPSERAAEGRRADDRWTRAHAHEAVTAHPGLEGWLRELRRSGGLDRAAGERGDEVLGEVLSVLATLPTEAAGRAVIAAELFGDAHALDDERPRARLALSALAWLEDVEVPGRASGRRELWSRYGVLADETSSTVLTLGLRPEPAGPLTRGVAVAAGAGVPLRLTLQMLRAEAWTWRAPGVVSICENPAVLGAAARRFGAGSPAMVCAEGMPSVSVRELCAGLARSGAELRYHGDFDAGGVRIANVVIGELGAAPWRMGAEDYRGALARAGPGPRLRGRVPEAVWDGELGPAIEAAGVSVQEEQMLEVLLGDLASPRASG